MDTTEKLTKLLRDIPPRLVEHIDDSECLDRGDTIEVAEAKFAVVQWNRLRLAALKEAEKDR